ncbi:ATP-binding protein [Streptomyces acidiscabies]|uniref:ATP-binding protein n=1 Tax=Streptomyces acidiscabies TaxID=42234 RepID=UPI0038F7E383
MNQQTDTPALTFTTLLSPTPRGASRARQLTAEQLRRWGTPLTPATQIVAELATNAATHGRVAGRSFRLALHLADDILRLELTDTRGDDLPQLPTLTEESDSGRGLLLVDSLATRWGWREGPSPCKTVWAEVDL